MDRKERFELINKIVTKAMKFMAPYADRVTVMMDLDNADRSYNLRLQEMLDADDMDFFHDVCGICSHMDRDMESPTFGKCKDLFVPRFAGKY